MVVSPYSGEPVKLPKSNIPELVIVAETRPSFHFEFPLKQFGRSCFNPASLTAVEAGEKGRHIHVPIALDHFSGVVNFFNMHRRDYDKLSLVPENHEAARKIAAILDAEPRLRDDRAFVSTAMARLVHNSAPARS